MYNDELKHFGVKGMKWGHRKIRNHAGPGKYATRKRQQAGDKRDLEALNKGQHLSVGLTKKRQAKFDARDKAAIEKRMAKNEAEALRGAKAEYKQAKKTVKEQQRQYGTLEDARTYKNNVKQKDVYKTYGSIEDTMRYSKYGNKKAESYAKKALDELDRQLASGKKKDYDMTKVNNYIDKALDAIDKELAKYN